MLANPSRPLNAAANESIRVEASNPGLEANINGIEAIDSSCTILIKSIPADCKAKELLNTHSTNKLILPFRIY